MKSKEEILAHYGWKDFLGHASISQAMDEWAKQEAIAFAEFMKEFDHNGGSLWGRWEQFEIKSKRKIYRTTEQLYNLYLQSKKQKV